MSARVVVTRGDRVESEHVVHVAVVDADGRLVARAGEPARVAFLRSAAKPFQALPLVEDGAAERFGVLPEELALCCASHSGEPPHLAVARSLLGRAGAGEADLACGPHEPLGAHEAERMRAEGERPRAVHNNCSGKHAGMLALARFHGWPREGYHREAHPVQRRMAREVARWTGLTPAALGRAVDGCGVVTFAAPLQVMAAAFARLGAAAAAGDPGPAAVVAAMTRYPFMVGGTGRLCTDLMEAAEGDLVAKTGAEGVYCAAAPARGLGVALKVEDGARRAQDPALVEVLATLGLLGEPALARLTAHRAPPVRNTRREVVGALRAEVRLEEVGAP